MEQRGEERAEAKSPGSLSTQLLRGFRQDAVVVPVALPAQHYEVREQLIAEPLISAVVNLQPVGALAELAPVARLNKSAVALYLPLPSIQIIGERHLSQLLYASFAHKVLGPTFLIQAVTQPLLTHVAEKHLDLLEFDEPADFYF